MVSSVSGQPDPAPLRFGISSEVLIDVNESDTRAALKIWAATLGSERGVPADPAIPIFPNIDAIKGALQDKSIDVVAVTTMEFWTLRQSMALGPIILGRNQGKSSVEYLLLVGRDAPVTRLADLRGRSVNLIAGPRGGLAGVWLDTLLLEENLGPVEFFWGQVERSGKISRIVLPVFFHQVDACVVTREGFQTMTELNPQMGRQLRILAQSVAVVPAVSFLRADFVSPLRDKLLASLALIADTVAGRQTLALFQSEQIEAAPLSELDSSLALLNHHARLLAASANSGAGTLDGPLSLIPEEKKP